MRKSRRKLRARARGEEDSESQSDDEDDVPEHQLSEYLISMSGPGILDRPRIKGRHLVLPNGLIIIMPAVMETMTSGEGVRLQREIDEGWEISLLPTSTKDGDSEWIGSNNQPYVLAGAHPCPAAELDLETLIRRSSLCKNASEH